MKNFDEQLLRLKQGSKLTEDQDVATLLGMTKAAFSERKRRDAFPADKVWALATQRPDLNLDVDYILNGRATSMAFGTTKQIGTRLRKERLRINWGDADMARHLGCTLADYVALEDGLRAPNPKEVIALRAHDELDAEMVLVGASLKRPAWELDQDEAELVTNYRASNDDARERIRQTAATAASAPKRGTKAPPGKNKQVINAPVAGHVAGGNISGNIRISNSHNKNK